MKQKLHLLAMLFVAATMTLGLAGCQPDEPGQPAQPTPEEIQSLALAGTSWEATVEQTTTQQAQGVTIEMNVSLNAVIDILDSQNAALFLDVAVEVPAAPAANQNVTQDDTCAYTFDGTTLVLHNQEGDGFNGGNDTLTYHADANTFTLHIYDPDAKEMLGVSELTFHQTRGGRQ